jgi:hypothetical protein
VLELGSKPVKRGEFDVRVRNIFMIAAGLFAVSCAANKTMEAVGGSRSDGTVKLAFEYGAFEKPHVDTAAGLETAKARCAAWGYTDAEAFGAATTQCTAMSGYGCMRTMVTVEYQCTGAGTPH